MRPEELDLNKFRKALEKSLKLYTTLLDVELGFQEFPDLSLTPNKPNSARTIIPITYAGTKVGNMYAIVFLQGDGTGDNKTYGLDDIIIPAKFKYDEKPERVIPRAKTGIIAEGFFPLFSMNQYDYITPFAAHLDELTLNKDKVVVPTFQLGQNEAEYLRAIDFGLIQLTTGMDKSGNRFGDPHAIYYGVEAYDSVQVVGFLPITDSANPLMNLVNKWKRPPKI